LGVVEVNVPFMITTAFPIMEGRNHEEQERSKSNHGGGLSPACEIMGTSSVV
jgi:hypothetical protein